MGFDWTTPQLTMDILFGTRTASFWGGNSTSSIFNQQPSPAPSSNMTTSSTSVYAKPTQPFYTVSHLGPSSGYQNLMPTQILRDREKYGYNVPQAPFSGPSSVDVFKEVTKGTTKTVTKIGSMKMTKEQAASVYAPVLPGQKDKYKDIRTAYSGKKVSTQMEKQDNNMTYQSAFDEKFNAGTWWGR